MLLRTNDYLVARRKVEQPCLDVLTQWREDEEDDPDAMEDILREVIVIPDDDDDGDDDDVVDHNFTVDPGRFERSRSWSGSQSRSRENSVEFVSAQTIVDSTVEQPPEYTGPDQRKYLERRRSPAEYRYVRPDPRYSEYSAQRRPRLLREENHRQQAWEEARTRRRQNPVIMYPKQWAIGHDDWDQIRVAPLDPSPQHIDLTKDHELNLVSPPQQRLPSALSRRSMTSHDTARGPSPAKLSRIPQAESHSKHNYEESTRHSGSLYNSFPSQPGFNHSVDRMTKLSNPRTCAPTQAVHEESSRFMGGPNPGNGESHPLSGEFREATDLYSSPRVRQHTPSDLKTPIIGTTRGHGSGTQRPGRLIHYPIGNSPAEPPMQITGQRQAHLNPARYDRRIVFLRSPNESPVESFRVQPLARILDESGRERPPFEMSQSVEQSGRSGDFLGLEGAMASQDANRRRFLEVIPVTKPNHEPGDPSMELDHHFVSTQDPGLPRRELYPVYDQFTTHPISTPARVAYHTESGYRRFDNMAEQAQPEKIQDPFPALHHERHNSSRKFEETMTLVSPDDVDRRTVLLPRDYSLSNPPTSFGSEVRNKPSHPVPNNVEGPRIDHRIRLLPTSEHSQQTISAAAPTTLSNIPRNPVEHTLAYFPRADGENKVHRARYSKDPRIKSLSFDP